MELLHNNYLKKQDTQHTLSENSSIGKGMAQEGFGLRAFIPFKSVRLVELPVHTLKGEKFESPQKVFSSSETKSGSF